MTCNWSNFFSLFSHSLFNTFGLITKLPIKRAVFIWNKLLTRKKFFLIFLYSCFGQKILNEILIEILIKDYILLYTKHIWLYIFLLYFLSVRALRVLTHRASSGSGNGSVIWRVRLDPIGIHCYAPLMLENRFPLPSQVPEELHNVFQWDGTTAVAAAAAADTWRTVCL